MYRSLKVFSFIIFFSGLTFAQTVDEILKNYFDKIGEKNILQKTTLTAKGKLIQGEVEIPFKAIQKRPMKMRMDATLQGLTLTQAFDGKIGWQINPFMGQTEPESMTEEQIDQMALQADFDGPFYNYAGKGYKVETTDPDSLDKMKLLGLKLIRSNGEANITYFDSENFIPVKSVSETTVQGVAAAAETFFSNYKEVEGVLIPFKIETKFNGQTVITMVFDEIKYDEEINDSVFVMPAPADSLGM